MSGGSYDYLCSKSAQELLENEGFVQGMSDRLAGLGYASDAARETEELLLIIRQCQNRIATRLDRLRPVWKAVEWWDSADWDEEEVKKALAKYREENPNV